MSGASLRTFVLAAALGLSLPGCHGQASGASNGQVAAAPRFAPPRPSGRPATQGVVVQAGDSIGLGVGANDNWNAIEHLSLPHGITVDNVSVSGQWMLTGLGRREADIFPSYDRDHASVLVIQQGTNDLVGGNAGDYLYQNILKPFVQLSQAAGFYVAVETILPRADPGWTATPAHERARLDYNRLVRANSIGADAIIDIAGDPVIGDGVDPAKSPMFFDKLHLTRAGQERILTIIRKPIATLLESEPRKPERERL